jgi:two-component system, cell cycle sensor histidine kinase and response regulator CckA
MYQPTQEDLQRFYERSPVGFYRSSAAGKFIFANPALAKILGYDNADELSSLVMGDDVYCDPAERAALIDRYRERGVVDGVRVRWRRKDGTAISVRIFGYVVRSESDITFDATLIDVTELEATEAALAAKAAELETSSLKLRMFLRQMPMLVWTVDRELRITSSDGAVKAVMGYERGLNVGRTLYDLFQTEDQNFLPIARHIDALEGAVVTYESEFEGKDFVTTIAPQRDAGNAVVGAIAIAIDVTSHRRLERRMVDAQRAESLGVLAGGLAHDFNNLLVAILGNADLGLRELAASNTKARGPLQNVRDAALRAAELTTQLLAYAGRGDVASNEVELAPVVEELVRILQPSIPAHITVTVAIDENLPKLRADSGALRQVVMNLLSNARDAIGDRKGSIALAATRSNESPDGTVVDMLPVANAGVYAIIAVTDDGPGMSAETKRRIFDPFFTTKPTGHGLGLASVIGIVRSHGGGIRVTSALGQGTRFEILWPVKTSARMASSPVHTEPSHPSAHILVIDDDEMVRDVLSRMLGDLGYAVESVVDGAAAVAAARTRKFHLAILDLTMPGLSGAPLVAQLQTASPGLPIIVCSGYDRDHKGPMPVQGYLAKPFRLTDLETMVSKVIASRLATS